MPYDRNTALVVVDVQNDFADPEGGLYVPGGEDVIDHVNAEIAEARAARGLVVYTQDWHPESTPHFAKDGGTWPVHCVAGTWGARLHSELARAPEASKVRKGEGGEDGYSGFTIRDPKTGEETSTGLEALLREREIERVVVVGLATDYCVKETALDAAAKGFATTVLCGAIRAVDLEPGDGERALAELRGAGVEVA